LLLKRQKHKGLQPRKPKGKRRFKHKRNWRKLNRPPQSWRLLRLHRMLLELQKLKPLLQRRKKRQDWPLKSKKQQNWLLNKQGYKRSKKLPNNKELLMSKLHKKLQRPKD